MTDYEKILIGMELIKEGCSNIPTEHCGFQCFCPLSSYCYKNFPISPENWATEMPHD